MIPEISALKIKAYDISLRCEEHKAAFDQGIKELNELNKKIKELSAVVEKKS